MKGLVSQRDAASAPTAARLAGKVALLAGLAAALALGHRQPLALWWGLLEGFFCAAAALDVATALISRESILRAYNHWHEATVLVALAFLSRMAMTSFG